MSFRPITILTSAIQQIITFMKLDAPVVEQSGLSMSMFQQQRAYKARDLLVSRLEAASLSQDLTISNEELLAVLYGYMQAAVSGTPLINLDLLSQAIAGELKREKLNHDLYMMYFNILSALTRDEIAVIGAYFQSLSHARKEAEVKHEIFLGGLVNFTWQTFRDKLVPRRFQSEEHVKVIMGGLIRTGLVKVLTTTIDDVGVPQFTILLDEIGQVVEFQKSYELYPHY